MRAHGVVQKGAVVRDDQRAARAGGQPAFQPFQHGDIQVVGRLVEQQELRLAQQHQRQRKARLLPAAQAGRRAEPGRSHPAPIQPGSPPRGRSRRTRCGAAGRHSALQSLDRPGCAASAAAAAASSSSKRLGIARGLPDDLAQRNGRIELKALGQVADAQVGVAAHMPGIRRSPRRPGCAAGWSCRSRSAQSARCARRG